MLRSPLISSHTRATISSPAATLALPSFFSHHFSRTRASSLGSEQDTSEESRLRSAMPRCLTILSTIAASAFGVVASSLRRDTRSSVGSSPHIEHPAGREGHPDQGHGLSPAMLCAGRHQSQPEPFVFSFESNYIETAGQPAMTINWRCNKPFGPGGGTRRLHHKRFARTVCDGGETGSTRV